MIRGLYASASGMVAISRQMEVVTNNLSNAQTNGYKQDLSGAAAFAEQLLAVLDGQVASTALGPLSLSDVAQAPELDLSQGSLQATGRALDLALEGPGFFAIQTADGIHYTRDGSFAKDAQGRLVTAEGDLVLGENGPLQLPDGRVAVGPDGAVMVDDRPVERLLLVDFAPGQVLERVGKNELAPLDAGAQPTAIASTVHQGMIEASNVDVTGTMTVALQLQRAYEANQRMIQTQDDLMARAVNDLAKPVT